MEDFKQKTAKALMLSEGIIKLCKRLNDEKQETFISGQLLRCGTAVGAELYKVSYNASMIAGLGKALKEIAETEYWLKLLIHMGYIDENREAILLDLCLEIKNVLTPIYKIAEDNKV